MRLRFYNKEFLSNLKIIDKNSTNNAESESTSRSKLKKNYLQNKKRPMIFLTDMITQSEYFISEYDLDNVLVGLPTFLKMKSKTAYPYLLKKILENFSFVVAKIEDFGILKSVYLSDLIVENSDFEFFDERIKFISETDNIEIYDKITQIERIFEHKSYLKHFRFLFPVVSSFNALDNLNNSKEFLEFQTEEANKNLFTENKPEYVNVPDYMDIVDIKPAFESGLDLMDIVANDDCDNINSFSCYTVNYNREKENANEIKLNKNELVKTKIFKKDNIIFSCLTNNSNTAVIETNIPMANKLMETKFFDNNAKEENKVFEELSQEKENEEQEKIEEKEAEIINGFLLEENRKAIIISNSKNETKTRNLLFTPFKLLEQEKELLFSEKNNIKHNALIAFSNSNFKTGEKKEDEEEKAKKTLNGIDTFKFLKPEENKNNSFTNFKWEAKQQPHLIIDDEAIRVKNLLESEASFKKKYCSLEASQQIFNNNNFQNFSSIQIINNDKNSSNDLNNILNVNCTDDKINYSFLNSNYISKNKNSIINNNNFNNINSINNASSSEYNSNLTSENKNSLASNFKLQTNKNDLLNSYSQNRNFNNINQSINNNNNFNNLNGNINNNNNTNSKTKLISNFKQHFNNFNSPSAANKLNETIQEKTSCEYSFTHKAISNAERKSQNPPAFSNPFKLAKKSFERQNDQSFDLESEIKIANSGNNNSKNPFIYGLDNNPTARSNFNLAAADSNNNNNNINFLFPLLNNNDYNRNKNMCFTAYKFNNDERKFLFYDGESEIKENEHEAEEDSLFTKPISYNNNKNHITNFKFKKNFTDFKKFENNKIDFIANFESFRTINKNFYNNLNNLNNSLREEAASFYKTNTPNNKTQNMETIIYEAESQLELNKERTSLFSNKNTGTNQLNTNKNNIFLEREEEKINFKINANLEKLNTENINIKLLYHNFDLNTKKFKNAISEIPLEIFANKAYIEMGLNLYKSKKQFFYFSAANKNKVEISDENFLYCLNYFLCDFFSFWVYYFKNLKRDEEEKKEQQNIELKIENEENLIKKPTIKNFNKEQILTRDECETDYGEKRVTKKERKQRENYVENQIKTGNEEYYKSIEDDLIQGKFDARPKKVSFSIPTDRLVILSNLNK